MPTPPDPKVTLANERAKAPFDVTELTYVFGAGKEAVELKNKHMMEFERDPLFKLNDVYDLTVPELRERTIMKFRSMAYLVQTEPVHIFTKRFQLISMADPAFWTRFGVHFGLFFGAVQSQSTPAQFSYWIDKGAFTLNGMVGCFGMTELGHGSNVAGIETLATFNEDTDTFVIHTPTLTATKWWIGGAAHSATHCAVYARLIVKGKDYGAKVFIVPLRDPKTYALLPGISIGDIGKKMGRDGIDNGWIQFTNVQIPRAYMLMKFTQVTRDGQVFEPPLEQLAYGALLQGRASMIIDAGNTAKKAVTIAVRYALVRRQFASDAGAAEETQLIDYPIHQRRLIPLVAQAVAFDFTGRELQTMYENTVGRLETLSSDSDESELNDIINQLKSTHSTLAGLKAVCTWATLETIEKCRASLGGQGYSAYSGLPMMYNDQAVQCTWEGDNTILLLQAGRALVQSYGDALKGTKFAGALTYLNDISSIFSEKAPSGTLSNTTIVRGYEVASAYVVRAAYQVFDHYLKQGFNKEKALDQSSSARFIAGKVHVTGFIVKQFSNAVDAFIAERGPADPVSVVLNQLFRTYALWQVEELAAYFLQSSFFSVDQIQAVSLELNSLVADVRVGIATVIDAFNISDHIINSTVGKKSGDVYNNIFNQVRSSYPVKDEHPYFERLIKPLIFREPVSWDDADDIGIDDEIEDILAEAKEAADAKK